uniref:Acidic leucine-rich nuclear phosphoprotein 32-related protein 2-like n=1 Tax=Macrostomum lignano TaxID=282301 RepID=A0A1I8IM69_9PLAT
PGSNSNCLSDSSRFRSCPSPRFCLPNKSRQTKSMRLLLVAMGIALCISQMHRESDARALKRQAYDVGYSDSVMSSSFDDMKREDSIFDEYDDQDDEGGLFGRRKKEDDEEDEEEEYEEEEEEEEETEDRRKRQDNRVEQEEVEEIIEEIEEEVEEIREE